MTRLTTTTAGGQADAEAPDPAAAPPRPPAARRRAAAKRRRNEENVRKWEIWLPLGLYLLFTLIPFYWMLLYAFRPNGTTGLAPWPLTLDHLRHVWTDVGFGTYFANSVKVGVISMVATSFVALAGGYGLARYDFRGRKTFMLAMLCTQFIPGALMLVPLFEIFKKLELVNSLWSVIVAETVFQLPLSLILISGFIRNVPMELEEAAWVDGASRLRGFLVTVLPLLRPGLIAVSSFAFIHSWNHFLFALMFLSDQEKYTVPVGLSYTIGESGSDLGSLAAGGVVAALPVIVIFALIQRYLVKGLSAGAVKG
ncbi:carbohydrate ABC transporter permease [Actinomadura sp. 6N118]|uniref:carbohydrate ABC transporter permease n=1 Tax=Actinomadura sp. 6N118 TaxID=3375151 RepID=UPI0037A52284